MRSDRHSLQCGMPVQDAAGRRIGKVYRLGEDFLLIRLRGKRGLWMTPDAGVEDLRDGRVRLKPASARAPVPAPDALPGPLMSVRPLPP